MELTRHTSAIGPTLAQRGDLECHWNEKRVRVPILAEQWADEHRRQVDDIRETGEYLGGQMAWRQGYKKLDCPYDDDTPHRLRWELGFDDLSTYASSRGTGGFNAATRLPKERG